MKSKSIKKALLFPTLFFISFLFLSLHSCDDDDKDNDKDNEELTLTVASEQLMYDGNLTFSPYLVKADNSDQWTTISNISGLDYESGYEYLVRVKKEKWHDGEVADASMYRHNLLEVISKTKKDSENMPEQELLVKIASEKNDDVDNPYNACIGPESWKPFPEIEGFEYEEGYEYSVWLKRKFNGSDATPKFSFIYVKTEYKIEKLFSGSEN